MRGSVEHISEEHLENYALGTLPGDLLETLEAHLLLCEECQDRWAEAEAFIQALRDAAPQLSGEPQSAWRHWLARFVDALRAPKVVWSVGVLAAVAGVTWLHLIWVPSHQASSSPVSVMLQTFRGATDASVARAPSGRPLVLEADLSGLPQNREWELRLVDSSGRRQRSFLAESGEIRLAVPVPSGLGRGAYWARIYARGQGQLLREYALQVD